MALPPVLINHGEKIAVALVVLFAVFLVWSAATDEATTPPRPAPIVEADFSLIEQAQRTPGQPNLRPAPDIAGHIRTRLALPAEFAQVPVMAYVHEIWSLGKTTELKHPPFLYGYELHPPRLRVEDRVGSLGFEVMLPEPQRPQQGRVRDAREFTESRLVDRANYNNSAAVLGVQVEQRQGDGPWEPLAQAGNDLGLIPLSSATQPLSLTEVSEWQTYDFRARLLAMATGPVEPGMPTLGNEVLVFSGASPLPAEPSAWEEQDNLSWEGVPLSLPTAERASDALRQQAQAIIARPPQGVQQLYLGPWSEVVSEQVSSTTRFVLIRVSPPVMQGQDPRVQFALTRMQDDQWIPLVRSSVEIGDMVGNAREVINLDGRNIPVDLSTPFRLVDVNLEAERITHYEIRNVSDGTRRIIDIVPRVDRAARTVTLENTATNRPMTLVQLARAIRVSPPSDILVNFPDFPAGTINEQELFEADPMAFRQPRLQVPEPIWREADDPTFAQHFPNEAALMVIKTRYLELPDGRFVLIDDLNDRQLFVYVKPDSDYARGRDQVSQDEEDEADEGAEAE